MGSISSSHALCLFAYFILVDMKIQRFNNAVSKYPIQVIFGVFLVYDLSAAPLLFKIGTFCVPTEVESGFGILSQNRDCLV